MEKMLSEEQLKIMTIAKVCHDANTAWCAANGDNSQHYWSGAADWQKNSAIKGVEFRLNNPNASNEEAQHEAWMADKIKDGWVYGQEKNEHLKTHPCLVPFNELPIFQQKKDKLFCAIVDALK